MTIVMGSSGAPSPAILSGAAVRILVIDSADHYRRVRAALAYLSSAET
jgi:hypothetical protein